MTQIAVFGKHPSFGDFMSSGVPPRLRAEIQTWVTQVYAQAKEDTDRDWNELFDAAHPVRFWLGPKIFGQCLRGVLHPSQDLVGRRYSLLALSSTQTMVPPTLEPDQSPFGAMEAHLGALLERPLSDVGELSLGAGLPEGDAKIEDTLWAVNPDAPPADLLQAAGSADYIRAAGARSYWWCAPDSIRSGAMWSCSGLAGADALLWLMSGVGRVCEAKHDRSENEHLQTTTGDAGLD